MKHDMLKGNLVKALITFSIPLILSGLLQQLYSWADAFIVGNVEGEVALAAIGATNAVTNLLIMTVTGFASGVSILSARCFGQEDHEAQKKILFTFTAVLGVVFTILSAGMIYAVEQVLQLLKTPEDMFDTAKGYLQIVLTGVPFLAVYNVYAAVLRGIGDSKAQFYAVLISSVINVLLDILFVKVFGWKAEGAAFATVVSQVLMTIFVVRYASRRYEMMRYRFREINPELSVLKAGLLLALPITVQSVVRSSGNLILQNFMNSFGTSTVAAITTAYRIDSLIMLPVINLGTGIATITSQNIGANKPERVKKCLLAGWGLTAAVSVGLTAFVLMIGVNLIQVFGVSPEATQIGRDFFAAIAWFYIVFGSSMAFRGYAEGRGKVIFSGVCGIMTLGVRIGLSYILRPLFGNMVIAYAEIISWCFQFLVYVVFVLRERVESR